MDFEWDLSKAHSNEEKHNVSFQEACEVFSDILSSSVNDPDHSVEEDRCLIFGQSQNDNVVVNRSRTLC
jgi:uncharacterized protein